MQTGPLELVAGKIQGKWPEKQFIVLESKKCFNSLQRVCEFFGVRLDTTNDNKQISSSSKFKENGRVDLMLGKLSNIKARLISILASESYKYTRKIENMRILPETLNPYNLRIFKKIDNRQKQIVHDNLFTMKYDYEMNLNKTPNIQSKTDQINNNDNQIQKGIIKNEEKLNRDFAIVYVKPELKPKHSLIANAIYMLDCELKSFRLMTELVKNDRNEYDFLIDGMIEGINKHYSYDQEDQEYLFELREKEKELNSIHKNQTAPSTLDFIGIEKFILMLDQADRILDRIDYLKRRKDELVQNYELRIDNRFQDVKNETRHGLGGRGSVGGRGSIGGLGSLESNIGIEKQEFNDELQNIQVSSIRLEKAMNLIVDQLVELDYKYEEDDMQDIKAGLKQKISKKRYYIHHTEQNFERNLQNERYRINQNQGIQLKDTPYVNAIIFKNLEQDNIQSAWIKTNDNYMYNLVKPDELRKDHTIVDKIILPNEERVRDKLLEQVGKTLNFKNLNK